MSKCPNQYEEEGNALAAKGQFLEAAQAFESAAGASLGASRAFRYEEAAAQMRTIHDSGVKFYLAGKVNEAHHAALAAAKPMVPSHAQIVEHMWPVVDELLRMPLADAIAVFRTQRRTGTWDQHVLAECKSAWREAGKI